MILKTLPVDKSKMKFRPTVFTIDIDRTSYRFKFSYNVYDENIYVSAYEDANEKTLFEGRKLVYGHDLMEYEPLDLIIIAYDFSGQNNKITYENFTEEIKMYVITGVI